MRTRLSIAILTIPVIACLGAGAIAETPASADAIPSATLTLEPATAEVSVTASPTEVQPSEMPTLTPIPNTGTATPDYAELETSTDTSTSPDGAWIAEIILAYPTEGQLPDYYQSLIVSRLDGSTTWVLIDEWSLWALGATSPRIVGWSSQAFFFSEYGIADGCGLFGVDFNVQQLSLQDGTVTEIPIMAGSKVALSPDAAYAAYMSRDTSVPEIVIYDLAANSSRTAPLEVGSDFEGAGDLVWSPDGQSLMLTVDHNGCVAPQDSARSIIRVDVSSFAQTSLIDHVNRLLRTQSWPEDNRVVLSEWEVGEWWMDAATGEIVEISSDG